MYFTDLWYAKKKKKKKNIGVPINFAFLRFQTISYSKFKYKVTHIEAISAVLQIEPAKTRDKTEEERETR